MGKLKQFNIYFRDSQAVYEAGRVVNGYVKLDLAEKSTIDSESPGADPGEGEHVGPPALVPRTPSQRHRSFAWCQGLAPR